MIRFSILIPVYNVEKYIEECLESVIMQTFHDFEVIVVDDGSTDDSGKICDRYAERFDFIHVYHNMNNGLLFTRRFAIEKAVGEYIINLDSDDSLEKKALEIINNKLNLYNCDCLIYGLNRYRGGEKLEAYSSKSLNDYIITDKKTLYKEVLSDDKYNSLCRKAVKRNIYGNLNFSRYYRVTNGEDLIQSLEIYKYAESFVVIPENLYNYRMNPLSMTHTKKLEDVDDTFTVRNTVLEFLKEQNVFNEEDYKQYRSQCVLIFVRNLLKVARATATYKEKQDKLFKIKSSQYYSAFLAVGPVDKRIVGEKIIFYALFQKGYFGILIGLENIYSFFFGKKEK